MENLLLPKNVPLWEKWKAGRYLRFLLISIMLIISLPEARASIIYDSSHFTVTYNQAKACYEINMVVQHSERGAFNAAVYGVLRNVTIGVKTQNGTTWQDLFYITGISDRDPVFNIRYCLYNGAGYIEETKLTTSNQRVSYTKKEDTLLRKTFYWYPDESWVGETPSFCIKSGYWDRQSTTDTNFSNSFQKSGATMTNRTRSISITENSFKTNGHNRISYSISGFDNTYDAGTIYLQRSTDGGSNWTTLTSKAAASSGTFEGEYMLNENSFRNGVTFRLQNRVTPDKNKYNAVVFRSTSNNFMTDKIATLSNISATQTGRSVKISWTYNIAQGSQDTSPLELLVLKPGVTGWENAIVRSINFDSSKSSDETLYELTDDELEKGIQNYKFMIRRTKFERGSIWKNFFEKETSYDVNTDYKKFQNLAYDIEGTSLKLNWNLTTVGYWSNSELKYQVKIDGVTQPDAPASDVTSYEIRNLERCKTMTVSLHIVTVLGNREIDVRSTGEILIPNDTESQITDFNISKGYYTDKVLINWQVPANAGNFNYFVITRSQVDSDLEPVTLVQLDHNKNIYSYQDNSIDAGEYYEYTVTGYTECAGVTAIAASAFDIGFSQPYASVSGRIAYDGSQAVKDVDVMVVGDQVMQNRGLDFSSSRDGYSYVAIPRAAAGQDKYTFQVWVKPNVFSETGQKIILQDNFSLGFTGESLTVSTNEIIYKDTTAISLLEYIHLSITVNQLSANTCEMQLFVNGSLSGEFTLNGYAMSGGELLVGASGTTGSGQFDGYMDEIRLWSIILTEEEILANYDRFLSGKETGLTAYYRCDEPDEVANVLFDISAVKSNFNKNDAVFGNGVSRTSRQEDVPTHVQLSNKGRTDEYGNYLINTIPYTNEGNVYNIIPMFGVHAFNPSSRPVFVSPSSRSLNNIDFTDVSAFDISGRITYAGTDFPVEGASFYIDGMICSKDNEIIYSNPDGTFTISVPIGEHFITVKKDGHVFENDGRYPADPQGIGLKRVFESPLTGLLFTDNTLVTLAGRVAGGEVQQQKPLGFGESSANIGKATITLQLQEENKYMLNTENEGLNLDSGNEYIDSKATIAGQSDKIVIETCGESGEFTVQLPPVPLKVIDISTMKLDKTELGIESIPAIDITNPTLTYTDTIRMEDGKLYEFEYHHAMNINYRVPKPTFRVNDKNTPADDAFGEEFARYTDEASGEVEDLRVYEINPENEQVSYTFNYPVFTQQNKYVFELEAYEEYENWDNAGNNPELVEKDRVPLKESIVTIANEIGPQSVYLEGEFDGQFAELQENEVKLNEEGKGNYAFTAGFPNINDTYLLNLTIQYTNGDKYEQWDKNGAFKAYVFGVLPSGNNFVTAGPDEINMVLRDPPGSESYAYMEEGTTVTSTHTYTETAVTSNNASVMLHGGAKNITITGTPAVGIITEMEIQADFEAGVQINYNYANEKTTVKSTTFTSRISTSDSPDFVGSAGDVFIGNSTNMLFGMARYIGLMKDPDGNFTVGKDDVMTTGTDFSTAFNYTAYHIENNLIPNLKTLRNSLLIRVNSSQYNENYPNVTDEPIYITTLDADDSRLGTNNDDVSTWGNDAVEPDKLAGPSYIMIVPSRQDTIFDNKIVWYNSQIALWENTLADNEERKLTAFDGAARQNYSFDAGVSIENSTTTCTSEKWEKTHEFTTQVILGMETGSKFSGIGISTLAKTETGGGFIQVDGEETETCLTTGYVLKDSDAGNYYSVDVFDAPDTYGVIFRTRGGQSSCPYEGAEVTKYYKPGTELSAATMQIEIPKLSVENPFATDVPSGKNATYILSLDNNSEAGEECWFNLRVLDETNPDGARLSIDGSVLAGRREILVKPGETMKKTLLLSQESEDILEYQNLKLVLASGCQDEIADTITISAQFVPTCSDITLQVNDFIVNTETSDTLSIIVKDYQMDYRNFKAIRLQYKSLSDLNWNLIHEYVLDPGDKTQNNSLLEEASITHRFPMTSLSDGTYDIRAITVCDFGNGEVYNESETYRIVKDMVTPASLGLPNPSNGILTPEGEVSVLFNEDIQQDKLTYSNFSVKGVLNGYQVRDNVGLDFDGSGSAYTELPVTANNSFSIEGWFRRELNQAGTLFTFGTQENYISLGFTAENKVLVNSRGNEPVVSDRITTDTDWQYIALVYDRVNNAVSVYLNSNSSGNISLITEEVLTKEPPQSGTFYIGTDIKGENNFKGRVRQVHFWNKTRLLGELSDMNTAKSGNEQNLIGYWNLEEGTGNVAADKARSRSLLLSTGWFIYPSGKSISFNGTDNLLQLDSSLYPFDENSDFSFEFWFKGDEQDSATLFSVGHGTKDETVNGKISVGINENGYLSLRISGNENRISDQIFTDNQWHHFAMSVRRGGNANIYIDNQQAYQVPASQIGRMATDRIYIGACHYKTADGEVTNEYFNGSVDEIRIWNSSLSHENLELDMYSKLSGSEAGLVAYYPFETYTYDEGNQLIITETLNDKSISDVDGESKLTASGNITFSDNTPPIRDARPVEDVSYTWTASDNKIVFNITEPVSRIENCILEFTVDRVLDTRNNRMASPLKWTAYIDLNRLKWADEGISLDKDIYEPLVFNTVISNKSGTNETYVIDNIPAWLGCSASTGVLSPQQSKELEFTVHESIPVGNYEAVLTLTGNNNFAETYVVSLKVNGERPGWNVNPNDYESSMTLTGQLLIENIYQEDTGDIVAAFIDGTCRGIASPVYITSHNSYYVFMDIYGDTDDISKPVEFNIWDASTGNTYTKVETSEDISFTPLQNKGSFENPALLNALNIVDRKINLRRGWNWISVNVESSSPSLFDMFRTGIGEAGILLKSSEAYVQAPGWTGTLSAVENGKMYRLQTNREHFLTFTGKPINVSEYPISIRRGWNWIGYLPSFSLPVNDALAGIEAQSGDQIRAHSGYATYIEGSGWIGSLSYMQPGQGYMYYSNAAQATLTYPSTGSFLRNARAITTSSGKQWSADPSGFQTNMTVTAVIFVNEDELQDENYELGIFKDNECRGSVLVQYEPYFDRYIAYLMAYGDTGEELSFRLFNHTENKEVALDGSLSIPFVSDAICGTPDNPYELYFTTGTGIELQTSGLKIYPNPVDDRIWFTLPADMIRKIEIVDIHSKLMIRQENIQANNLDVTGLAPGVYFIHFFLDGKVISHKFIKN